MTNNRPGEKHASEQRTAGNPGTDSCRYKIQQGIHGFYVAILYRFCLIFLNLKLEVGNQIKEARRGCTASLGVISRVDSCTWGTPGGRG